MDITQVAPKVGCATAVCEDFATNAALDMLLIALLEVLPNTGPLRLWDSHGLRCLPMRLNRGSWRMRALRRKTSIFFK